MSIKFDKDKVTGDEKVSKEPEDKAESTDKPKPPEEKKDEQAPGE